MAQYIVYAPTYVNGLHLAQEARLSNPIVIEAPDEQAPSLTWDPVDEVALRAYNALVEQKIKTAVENLIPATKDAKGVVTAPNDQAKIEHITAQMRKKYKKVIVTPPKPKPETREVGTNAEIAEAGHKVVGRMSDRSPV